MAKKRKAKPQPKLCKRCGHYAHMRGSNGCDCGCHFLDSPCPVCGQRIGSHKAVVGWMGKGCPTASSGETGK